MMMKVEPEETGNASGKSWKAVEKSDWQASHH